jgi:hypothetical protein
MLTAMGGLGMALGVDATNWNFASPFSFEGGPALQILRDAGDVLPGVPKLALGGDLNFQERIALSNLGRAVTEVPIPFGGMIQNIRQSQKETDETRRILTGLGFNFTKE